MLQGFFFCDTIRGDGTSRMWNLDTGSLLSYFVNENTDPHESSTNIWENPTLYYFRIHEFWQHIVVSKDNCRIMLSQFFFVSLFNLISVSEKE